MAAGGFDRLLRTSESVHEKWNYIRENPVRAGLVAQWKHWPYQRGFSADRWRFTKTPCKILLQQFGDLNSIQRRAFE